MTGDAATIAEVKKVSENADNQKALFTALAAAGITPVAGSLTVDGKVCPTRVVVYVPHNIIYLIHIYLYRLPPTTRHGALHFPSPPQSWLLLRLSTDTPSRMIP